MVLIIHIVVAILGLIQATALFFVPSEIKLKLTYFFIGSTLASGTFLIIDGKVSLVRACMSGIFYLSFASLLVYLSKLKMAAEISVR